MDAPARKGSALVSVPTPWLELLCAAVERMDKLVVPNMRKYGYGIKQADLNDEAVKVARLITVAASQPPNEALGLKCGCGAPEGISCRHQLLILAGKDGDEETWRHILKTPDWCHEERT